MKIIKKSLFSILIASTVLLPQKNGFGVSLSGQSSLMEYYYLETGVISPVAYWIYGVGATRLEAALGYWSRGNEDYSNSITSIGLGAMIPKAISENFSTYYGGRFTINLYKDDDEIDTAYNIAPVYGSEYIFGNNASIGGEIQLDYFSPEDSDWHTITLKSLIFLRFYY